MSRIAPLLAALGLTACAASDKSVADPPPIPLEDVRPFNATELSVATANNDFGVRLLKDIAANEAKPNLLISPLSASMALGMTMNGASGSTYDDMRTVLGFGTLAETAVNEAYRGLIAQLRARDPKVDFRLANGIWYRQGFDVKAPFLDAAKTQFDAKVSAIDFTDPTAPKTISRWAEEQTGGRIKDLVESISPDDMLFLVNAVYFKAPWSQPFEPMATRPQEFTRADGTRAQVPMMSRDGGYPFLIDNDVQIAELLYADSAYSMVLIAPASADRALAPMIAGLTAAKWTAWMNALRVGRVQLTLPKFKFDYDITMNDALKAMGMSVAFDVQGANFDRIHNQTRDDLYISKARQKAFIDVHELGTEAAAATSVTISVTSLPPQLRFDRPFLFAIRERSSGTILFAGRVGAP